MTTFDAIDVLNDLRLAFRSVPTPHDTRALVIARLLCASELSDAEAAAALGWSRQRVDRAAKHLRPDRRTGRELRAFFAAYLHRENKSARVVREKHVSAA